MVTRVGKFLGGLDVDVTDVLSVHATENRISFGAADTPVANVTVIGNTHISTNLVVNQGLGAVGNTAPATTDVSLGTPANVVIRTHAASGAGNVIVGDATATSAFNLDVHGTANVGALTSTGITGDVTGDLTGSIVTAAQGNITSVGTLTGLTIADDGNIGSASDTDAIAISAAGIVALSATTEASATGTAAVTTAGGIGVAKDMWIGDDIVMDSDLAAIKMGDAQAVSLTHVADTGVALNLGLGLAGNTAPIATALSMGTPANVVIRTFAATGVANVIIGDATATSAYNLDVRGTANTGALTASGLAYPTSDGTEDYVLSTDGSGTLSWAAQTGGGATNPATALAVNVDCGNFDEETSDAFGIIITDTVTELDCSLYAADALGTVDMGSVA